MSEWRKLRVGDSAETFAGGTPDRENPAFFGGSIPWVKSTEVNAGRIKQTEESLSEAGLNASAAKWIPAKTVLIAMYGATAAQVAFLEIAATANQAVLAVRPKNDVEPLFLFHALTARRQQLLYLAQGSGQPNLNKQIIDRFVIDAPNLPRQRRIAEILETVDEVIEQTEALIAKQQQVKAGLMHDLFTRGLTPDGQLRPSRSEAPDLYHETPLGWLPKQWMPTSFDRCVASRFLGTTIRGVGSASEVVPLIKMGNLVWGELELSEVEQLARSRVRDERHWLQPGDFLFNTRNTPELVGKTAVYRGEFGRCTYDNNLLRVRFKGGLDSRFVCHYMSHGRGQQRVFGLATGTTSVAAIYWSGLARYGLPVPSQPKESAEIAERVDTARATLAAETAHLAKLRQLKQGLMQDLLTGRVPVPV